MGKKSTIRKAGACWLFTCGACGCCFLALSWSAAASYSGAHAQVCGASEQPDTSLARYRCVVVGCNPVLYGLPEAQAHSDNTGHRIAKWPVRSAEGKRRELERNRNGYHAKYPRRTRQ